MADQTKLKARGRLAVALDTSRVETPTVFPGVINGVFAPASPVLLSDTGLTERAVQLLISDGLPLTLIRVGDAQKEE